MDKKRYPYRDRRAKYDSIYEYQLKELMDRIQKSNYLDQSEKETINNTINSIDKNTCTEDDMKEVTDLLVKMGLVTAPNVETGGGGGGEGEGETINTATKTTQNNKRPKNQTAEENPNKRPNKRPKNQTAEEAALEELRQNAATALLGIKNLKIVVKDGSMGGETVKEINTLERFFKFANDAKTKIHNAYNRCVDVFADSMIQASLASYLTGKLALNTISNPGTISNFINTLTTTMVPYVSAGTGIVATTAVGLIIKKVVGHYATTAAIKVDSTISDLNKLNAKVNGMSNEEVVNAIKNQGSTLSNEIIAKFDNLKSVDKKALKNLLSEIKNNLGKPDEPRNSDEMLALTNDNTTVATTTGTTVATTNAMDTKGDGASEELGYMNTEEAEEAEVDEDEKMDTEAEASEKLGYMEEEGATDNNTVANRITETDEEIEGGKRKSKKRRITKKKKHIKRKATKKKKYSKSKTKRKVHKKK